MDIKVEKDHDTHHEKRRGTPWWILPAVALGALALGLGLWNGNDDDRQATTTTENRQAATNYYNQDQAAVVSYQGRQWAPSGNAMSMTDNQVREVGRTAEGYSLFAPTGGGGAAGSANQFFLKVADGRYVPLRAR